MSYSGKSKIAFCRRLGNDWQDLATYLEIPAHRRNQFPQGRECYAILEWLEENDERFQNLSEALKVLGRDDLLTVLQLSQPISDAEVTPGQTISGATSQIDKQRLITLLLDCPSLRDTGTRGSLLKMLPHHIVDCMKVGNAIKESVINIVDGCMNYADGLQHLFAAIRFFDAETIQFQALIREFNLDKPESPPPVIGDIEKTITALMAQLHLSAQVQASDEFTQHNQSSLQLIREAMVQLKQLSPQTPEYGRVSLSVGSALASTGELLQAERLFTQIIENTDKKSERAIAYFNLFQVQLRREVYPEALENLQAAIAINPHYALHDLQKYPLERLLGAGGMGCVFLCQNHNHSNRLLAQHERVVVKCFWEHPKGRLDEVFKEPFAMRDIAGDYIPEPLDIGYADTIKRERAYFVTAYIDDAIDGEAWLEKYGPMDLETGLQVGLQIAKGLQIAHAAGICHLDLKPANILLLKKTSEVLETSEVSISVKIIDFGLSQMVPSLQQKAMTMQQSRAGLSQFGQAIFGTLDYACPEQQGFNQYGKPGVLCDVFAFGMTMSRFFTGKNPRYVRERDLPKVDALRDLLGDCVEENPKLRPESAQLLISNLTEQKQQVEERKRKEDENAWRLACQENTQSAYQTYLDGNTLKQYADEAEKQLQAIENERQAKLRRAEEERLAEIARCKRLAKEDEDEKAWQIAEQENTKFAYQTYLDGNTLKQYADNAKKRLQTIVEKAKAEKADKNAWKIANQQNTKSAYQAYLNGNTLKRFADDAKKQLQAIEKSEAEDAKKWLQSVEKSKAEEAADKLENTNVKKSTLPPSHDEKPSFFKKVAAYLKLTSHYTDNGDGTVTDNITGLKITNRYTDNGDGTVTDNRTGLIWLKNANCFNRQNWKTAMQSAANLADGQCGLSDGSKPGDWRLPTKEEWEAMVDKKYWPALSNAAGTDKWKEGDAFSGVQSNHYWSSTSNANGTPSAWRVNLNNGYGNVNDGNKTNTEYVWPVRGGH
jgi:serine/threonine protein kinase